MRHYYNTLLLALSLLFASNIAAQQNSELKREINEIKKNSQYIYAETTLPDKSDALNSAMESLQGQANSWAAKQGNGKSVANDVESIAKRIELPRGNMFRAFVYAKKEDILAGATGITPAQTTNNRTQATYIGTATKPEKPALPKAIERMLPITEYSAMASCIKQLKAEGEILRFARYTDDVTNLESYALVVYNSDGVIEAILSPGSQRTNYKTGLPDSLDNYRGGSISRGALIIKLKQ